MSKQTKPAPYANTKVDYRKTQAEIAILLEKYGIEDTQFTFMGSRNLLVIQFTRVEDINGQDKPVGVRLAIPCVTTENRDQLHRALYYYLKSKLECLQFGFVEFTKEFFGDLLIPGPGGIITTVYESLGPKYKQALVSGEVPELLLIPERL